MPWKGTHGFKMMNAFLWFLLLFAGNFHRIRMVGGTDTKGEGTESSYSLPVAFIPKFGGLSVFDQAYAGALAAHRELHNGGFPEEFAAPDPTTSGTYQVDTIGRITEVGGYGAMLLSNNAGDDIAVACRAASESGIPVVTWDSPIPSGIAGGESLFVSQVDFDETGATLVEMAAELLGADGGQFAILSAHAHAANQNAWIDSMRAVLDSNTTKYEGLEVVEIAYGDDDAEISYNEALRLVDAHPDLKLIVAPTTVGIVAASKALSDLGKCDTIQVSGLGDPTEMLEHTLSGCAPLFALWDFVDLGYLAYYAGHRLATGELQAAAGEIFQAGRLGSFTIEADPSRQEEAYRVIMGPFQVYNRDNIENAAWLGAIQGDGGRETFEERYFRKYKKVALAVIPKVTGLVSLVASAWIVWSVLASPDKRQMASNRVLIGVAASGMLVSFFGFFLSTWPIPAETWLVWGNRGTSRTCTMQGFFFQAGISATPLYAGALTTVYVLRIVWDVRREHLLKVEKVLHVFINLFAWGTAIAGLPLQLYNPADRIGFMCWIAEYPPYCSLRDNCQRGVNAYEYRWAFLYAWVILVFCYMMVGMLMIYFRVRNTERATDRYRTSVNQSVIRRQSKKVAWQGFYYVAAFVVPWIFLITLTVFREQHYGDIEADQPIALEVVNAIIFPLGGFLNFLVYMQPGSRGGSGSAKARRNRSGRSSLKSFFVSQAKHWTRSSSVPNNSNDRLPAVTEVAEPPKEAPAPFKNEEEKTEEGKEEEC